MKNKSLPTIKIEVIGPGGCLHSHVKEIKELFEKYGTNVEIEPDKYFEIDYYLQDKGSDESLKWNIIISPKNMPWGG